MAKKRAQYDRLLATENFKKLQKTCPILPTWSDHDYGANDMATNTLQKGNRRNVSSMEGGASPPIRRAPNARALTTPRRLVPKANACRSSFSTHAIFAVHTNASLTGTMKNRVRLKVMVNK